MLLGVCRYSTVIVLNLVQSSKVKKRIFMNWESVTFITFDLAVCISQRNNHIRINISIEVWNHFALFCSWKNHVHLFYENKQHNKRIWSTLLKGPDNFVAFLKRGFTLLENFRRPPSFRVEISRAGGGVGSLDK